MEGDCLDFKVLSAVVWGLLRKKVDDYTGQSPDEVYMMEVANAARIGAAYYEYTKVYLDILRSHLDEHGLLGHSVDVPNVCSHFA